MTRKEKSAYKNMGITTMVLAIAILLVAVFQVNDRLTSYENCVKYTEEKYGLTSTEYSFSEFDELEFDLYEFTDYDGHDKTIKKCFGFDYKTSLIDLDKKE